MVQFKDANFKAADYIATPGLHHKAKERLIPLVSQLPSNNCTPSRSALIVLTRKCGRGNKHRPWNRNLGRSRLEAETNRTFRPGWGKDLHNSQKHMGSGNTEHQNTPYGVQSDYEAKYKERVVNSRRRF